MKKVFMTLCACVLGATIALAQSPLYLNPDADMDARIEDALERMTLSEKINIIHAQSKFSSPGVPRLGIPGLWCTDGPHGIRAEVKWDEWEQAGQTNDSCLAFPALTCLAATWNPDMARLYGQAIGEEALYRGKHVLLGPGVNIYRTPLNGRNFEYMGEDPYLTSQMAVPYIQGVQSNGVAACVKHFALNNQEDGRHTVNVHVSDRALYELYLPAFQAAVEKGGVWSIMGAYNRYDGHYACHNHRLLIDILRDEWHFDGAVISDWGGCLNTNEAIHNGLDLEFGSWTDGLYDGSSNAYDRYYLATPYLNKIKAGEVGTTELDEKVRNVLRLIFRTAMNPDKGFGSLVSEEHQLVARTIADEGIVLLKNDKPQGRRAAKKCLLPIEGAQHILVVGENAIKQMTVGGGSSSLKAKYELSPLDGIRARAAQEGATVQFIRGYVGDIGGEYNGVTTGQDLTENRSAETLIDEAVNAAQQADIVLFVGGLNKADHQDAEGADRLDYHLPYGQDQLIAALAEANPNLVVITLSGNAFAMPWLNKVPALMQAWYSGSETGHAIADILFGDVNPSGHMPFTILPELTDYPAHQFGQEGYPGIANERGPQDVYYKEDIFVGYRNAGAKPLFAFGHGLSYTTFRIANAVVRGDTVYVHVTNTGKRVGKQVVQLYVQNKTPLTEKRPEKELKAFCKVELQPNETKQIAFPLTSDMFARFDENQHRWVTDQGPFALHLGRSVQNIECTINKYNLPK